MEEFQLEEAGLRVSTELDEWEATARECVEMALRQGAIAARVGWNEWVHAALEGGARKAHSSQNFLLEGGARKALAFSKLPVPDSVQPTCSVQEASQVAITSVLAPEKRKLQTLAAESVSEL